MSSSSRPRMASSGVYVTQHLPLLVGLRNRQLRPGGNLTTGFFFQGKDCSMHGQALVECQGRQTGRLPCPKTAADCRAVQQGTHAWRMVMAQHADCLHASCNVVHMKNIS